MRRLTVYLLAAGLLAGNAAADGTPSTAETAASFPDERSAIADALLGQGVLVDGRLLTHLSHVCNLTIGEGAYPVLDVRELVRGAVTPRGQSRIVVIDPEFALMQSFEYGQARPLFCDGNRLFLNGDLAVDNIGPEGNVLEFSAPEAAPSVTSMEANDFPAPEIGTPDFRLQ
ncbi:hypothetical protein [uncultured Roseibium sp.]|uniref:hypothetical protein n=1 Tax=uncultured Roseibium sp. TaxID=1936171 RepID=UPI002636FD0B|nr:hypothetical protein [uncultured Roseibium sp.]